MVLLNGTILPELSPVVALEFGAQPEGSIDEARLSRHDPFPPAANGGLMGNPLSNSCLSPHPLGGTGGGPVPMAVSAANFIAPRVECTATNEQQLSGSQSKTVSDG